MRTLILLIIPILLMISQSSEAQEHKKIPLPQPVLQGEMSVEEALLSRRSIRDFTGQQLTKRDLAQLLWAAYGVTQEIGNGPSFLRGGLKTAPSAGALYPLEVYALVANVEGIVPGFYRYMTEEHALERMLSGDLRKQLEDATGNQEMVIEAPLSIVFTAIYERTTNKYGIRGRDRYVCMDAGHAAQNVYLQATALNLGTCAMGAFTDEIVRQVLDLRPDEVPLYVMPVGNIKDDTK